MNRYDVWRNLYSQHPTSELQAAYNSYFVQKAANAATIDIAARFDGKGLEKQIIQAFKNTGARVVL